MGCRCFMCRAAEADYKRSWEPHDKSMVGEERTKEARNKVNGWLDQGATIHEISRATGITRNAIKLLITGKHHAARIDEKSGKYLPSRRMSRENYRRIMECKRPVAPKARNRVDASSVNAALKWLDEHGVTRAEVARMSGLPQRTVYSMGDRSTCEYKTLVSIVSVANELKEKAREFSCDS